MFRCAKLKKHVFLITPRTNALRNRMQNANGKGNVLMNKKIITAIAK